MNSYSLQGTSYDPSLRTIPQLFRTVGMNDGIPILWQASDSAVLARATIVSSSPAATSSMTPTASASTTDPPSQSSSGLSTGAKIGLGVGIPVAVIALLAMGFLLWRRRRKTQSQHELQNVQPTGYNDASAAQGHFNEEFIIKATDSKGNLTMKCPRTLILRSYP